MLAKTKIYQATDNQTYVLVSLTSETPTTESVAKFYEIITYVRSMPMQVVVVIDTRDAPSTQYLQYLDQFLRQLSNMNGDQVIRCDVYVKPIIGPFMEMIMKSLRSLLPNGSRKIHIKYFEE